MSKTYKLTPEGFNRWRVLPRVMVGLYGWLIYDVVHWFMDLSVPTTEQAGFVSVVITAAPFIFKFYVDSGASLKEIKESRE